MTNIVLTGSIGTGKTTVLNMFQDLGARVWSADKIVKSLYDNDEELLSFIHKNLPQVIENHKVNFPRLRDHLQNNPEDFQNLEDIIHPKVFASREKFLIDKNSINICEIPLYFETGRKGNFNKIIVLIASEATQRQRVLDRGTMNEEQLEMIMDKQIPSVEKVKFADYVINTDENLEKTRLKIQTIMNELRENDA